MGARKEQVHRNIGAQIAGAGIEKVILIKNSVTPFINDGLKAAGYKGDIIWFDDALDDAMSYWEAYFNANTLR